jgi:hypothetical protein
MAKGDSRLAAWGCGRRWPVNTGTPWMTAEQAQSRVLHHQRKLHKWASTQPSERFDDLWNLVCDPATLQVAWARVRNNQGSRTAGIDAVTRHHVEQRHGTDRFLVELRQSLRDRQLPATAGPGTGHTEKERKDSLPRHPHGGGIVP